MEGLTFDAEKHEYLYQGVKLPSVTQILADLGLYGDTAFWTPEARDRGTYVHQLIEAHLSGDLDEDFIKPKYRPYYDAWLRFLDESGYVPESWETALASERYKYAGTIDHFGHLSKRLSVIDVKTGQPSRATALQLAAYEMLLPQKVSGRYALHLQDNGRYKLIEYSDRNDKQFFLEALSLYNWKRNY